MRRYGYMPLRPTSNFSAKRLRRNVLLAIGLVCGLFILLQAYAEPTTSADGSQQFPELIEQATEGVTATVWNWVSKAIPEAPRSVTI